MNKLKSLCVVLALSTSPFAMNKEEDAVRKRVAEFDSAFNKKDAKAVAAFWAKDGDVVNPMGIAATGPEAIEKVVADDMTHFIRDGKITAAITNIRFVKSDVAILDMTHEVSGTHAPDGSVMPTMKLMVTVVAMKAKGTWWWLAVRPMVPFSPPMAQAAAPSAPAAATEAMPPAAPAAAPAAPSMAPEPMK